MNNKVTRGEGLLENFLAKKRADIADSMIPEGFRKGKVLDIGCGSYPYFLMSTKFENKYGIDPYVSKKITEKKNLNLYNMDVTRKKLPFRASEFDVVTMLAAFEHIDQSKLKFVLSETLRVLKKGGLLIVTTPSPWSDKLLHQMAKAGLISSEEIHEHKTHHTRSIIEKMIIESGYGTKNIKSGFFEFGFNMWFKAIK